MVVRDKKGLTQDHRDLHMRRWIWMEATGRPAWERMTSDGYRNDWYRKILVPAIRDKSWH